jgi:ABC-2 type transport system permease protein
MFTRVRAVAAKEFWALVRQPQLLILLLVGPVLIMAAFALSFRVDKAKPSAVVVVQPGSEGAELFASFVSHIDFQGTVESAETAAFGGEVVELSWAEIRATSESISRLSRA